MLLADELQRGAPGFGVLRILRLQEFPELRLKVMYAAEFFRLKVARLVQVRRCCLD
jgi:hypothetical protein